MLLPHISVFQKYVFVYTQTDFYQKDTEATGNRRFWRERWGNGPEGASLHGVFSLHSLIPDT